MTDVDDVDALADDELVARLINRGVPPDRAAAWVAKREDAPERGRILRHLSC